MPWLTRGISSLDWFHWGTNVLHTSSYLYRWFLLFHWSSRTSTNRCWMGGIAWPRYWPKLWSGTENFQATVFLSGGTLILWSKYWTLCSSFAIIKLSGGLCSGELAVTNSGTIWAGESKHAFFYYKNVQNKTLPSVNVILKGWQLCYGACWVY